MGSKERPFCRQKFCSTMASNTRNAKVCIIMEISKINFVEKENELHLCSIAENLTLDI